MRRHGRPVRFIGCAVLALLLAGATLPVSVTATAADWQIREDTTLASDFAGTIKIVRDGVTLDCDGYKVTGEGHGRGIVVDKRSNVTVKNCEVDHFSVGIWVSGTTASTFVDNYVHHSIRGP
ncbi:MAG TPA: hypothetical protein VLA23_07935, partial [Candidatus Limnocylindrales bacterium]|nr:hypothetical protein [Candidatus Limnocylindrales bacterium]